MKVNVKKARAAARRQRIVVQEEKTVEYIQALGCQFCRDLRQFGKVRLNRLIRGAYEEMTDYYEHYGGDALEDGLKPDNIPYLYVGLRNQVNALDVPIEKIEEEHELSPDFQTEWRPPHDRIIRQNRWEETERVQKMVRSFWYCMMLHLWHRYNWGQVRLTRFYTTVLARYSATMNRYLSCKAEADALAAKEIDETVGAIKRIGVKL